jgi:hypothetical protein
MATFKIPPPISGGLILSYKCQARCRHCIYACSPDWKADWITEDALVNGLSQLGPRILPSPWGPDAVGLNAGLHFSGGEPFLNFELLLKAVQIATEYEIPSTFVETNSSWCIDDTTARDKLERLKHAGLKGIMISVNPYYAEWVPFERTERCIRISQQVFGPYNTMVYQIDYYRQFVKLGLKDTISLEDYTRLAGSAQVTRYVELFFMGRATYELKALYATYPAQRFFHEPCLPAFLRDWHNHFDNYGHFMPGYCGGISLGSWLHLDHLLEAGIDLEQRPVLKFLIDNDMRGLFRFAQELGYQEAEDGYLSKCALCLDIRRYLITQQDFAELQPRQFYAHLA